MIIVPFSNEDKAALPDDAEVIVMGPPPGWSGSDCGTTEVVRLNTELPTGRLAPAHITKWMPTALDLQRLTDGGSIYLQTLGDGMPPVWCGTQPWGTDG